MEVISINSLYKICGIYSITNIKNGKRYIGKTQMNFGDRFDSHKSLLRNNKHFNTKLQNAWNKYGEDNFVFDVVEVVEDKQNLEKFNELEIGYIQSFNSINDGYNITLGGDGAAGKPMAESTKRKIGEKNRVNMLGRKASESTKAKMSKSHKGFTHSKESIEKIRQSKSGVCVKEETKEKLRDSLKGRPKVVKLNKEKVLEIRRLYNEGYSNRQLSEKFGITLQYMYGITSGRKWKNI